MSESDGSGAGRREVAYRLFASEFDDADFSHSESDEERAPNYVITPTGARVNRLFVVGVLTEVEQVSDDVLRGRVVDQTGAFVLYAGQYQPDEMAFLESAQPPMFVAVTGKARTFQPDDSDQVFTSIRPETINEVDSDTRDRWTVQAATQTLDRIAQMARALDREERGDQLRSVLEAADTPRGLAAGVPLAIDRYQTTPTYLDALREKALGAARIVAGDADELTAPDVAPDERGDTRLEPLKSAGVDIDPVTANEPTTEAESETQTATAADSTEHSSESTTAESGPEQTDVGDTASTETTSEPTPEPDTDSVTSSSQPLESESTTTAGTETDDLGDFDPGEYELEEETREQIEEEYGTEFQTGTEVEEPGAVEIEESTDKETEVDIEDDSPGEAESGESEESETTAEPADLQEAVVELMTELDEGDGADRATLFDEMNSRYGTGEEAVEDAIQGALMDGECYEPDDQTLKPI